MYAVTGNKKRSISIILKILILVIVMNLVSVRGVYANDEFIGQARNIVKYYYVDEVSEETLNAPTIEDMVKSLHDPYSQYFSAKQFQQFTNNINMKVYGIGTQIEAAPDGIKAVSVVEGSPAGQVGIQVGDIIITADGHELAGLPLEQASSYIKGEEGTVVHLQVKRNGNIYTYDVIRKEIVFPTVEGKILDNHIGYIRISSFGEITAEEFRKKLVELKKQNPDSFIIDIRNNGGGYLNTAIDIAGSFIEGKPVVVTKDRINGEITYLASKNVESIDKPTIMLVNEYSASASEVLSAAIKDYNKAYLVGTKTYGKGTVQAMFELFDLSILKLTIQRFYSPFGKTINKVGVSPDFEVNGVDSLSVAQLLLGNSGAQIDKRGYVKIKTSNRDFEIDLNKAKLTQYWNSFKYVVDKAAAFGDEIYIGTNNGWIRTDVTYLQKPFKLYYPQYKEISELNNVNTDKIFTIRFTGDIDAGSINDKDIELINSYSGERVALGFEAIDGRSIKVKPKQELKMGYTYYLIVNKSIKGKHGNELLEGTVTKVSVMP